MSKTLENTHCDTIISVSNRIILMSGNHKDLTLQDAKTDYVRQYTSALMSQRALKSMQHIDDDDLSIQEVLTRESKNRSIQRIQWLSEFLSNHSDVDMVKIKAVALKHSQKVYDKAKQNTANVLKESSVDYSHAVLYENLVKALPRDICRASLLVLQSETKGTPVLSAEEIHDMRLRAEDRLLHSISDYRVMGGQDAKQLSILYREAAFVNMATDLKFALRNERVCASPEKKVMEIIENTLHVLNETVAGDSELNLGAVISQSNNGASALTIQSSSVDNRVADNARQQQLVDSIEEAAVYARLEVSGKSDKPNGYSLEKLKSIMQTSFDHQYTLKSLISDLSESDQRLVTTLYSQVDMPTNEHVHENQFEF